MNILHIIKKTAFTETDGESFSGTELTIDSEEKRVDNGTFLNSLDELSEGDISLNETAEKKKKTPVSEYVRRVFFCFFLIAFIVSCAYLVNNLVSRRRAAEIYKRLEQEFFSGGFTLDPSNTFRPEEGKVKYLAVDYESPMTADMESVMSGEAEPTSADAPVHKKYNEELEKMRAGLASLAQINPDIYGWISVEGTNINYPLVQGEDNDFYLDHAYTGDFFPVGSIFVDYRCHESITKNYNTVIYGHNITTGEMFHDVTKFFRESYFNDTLIYIYTEGGIYVYEPFSIYESRYDYNYFRTGFSSPSEFIKFANELKSNSKLEKDVEFDKNSRILTLSTCTNGAYTQRYALHAVLVKTILD